MAEVKGNKKRLSINLSIFTLTDQNNNNKSPKKFEDPNGAVVGLGIVAAMNNNNNPMKSNYSTRAAILAISPRSTTSNPIPIFTTNNNNYSNSNSNNCKKKKSKSKRPSSIEEMEMCEEYTCVIAHVGSNLIKKREYFDGEFIGNINSTASELVVSSVNQGGGMVKFIAADFLNSCFLCKKQLQGLDIFMYRGEKAFCSAECRCTQISIDEHKEKCGSGAMKSLNEYSASPCSGPMQFFTGVAVA